MSLSTAKGGREPSKCLGNPRETKQWCIYSAKPAQPAINPSPRTPSECERLARTCSGNFQHVGVPEADPPQHDCSLFDKAEQHSVLKPTAFGCPDTSKRCPRLEAALLHLHLPISRQRMQMQPPRRSDEFRAPAWVHAQIHVAAFRNYQHKDSVELSTHVLI